jgi:hypothetical protein
MTTFPRVLALVFALGLGCVFTSRPQLPASDNTGDASTTQNPTSYDAAAPSDAATGITDLHNDAAAQSDVAGGGARCDDLRDAGDASDASDGSDAADARDGDDAGEVAVRVGCDAASGEVGPGSAAH